MGSDRRWAVSDQRLLHPPRTAAHDHSYLGRQPPRAQNLLGDPGRGGKACRTPGHPPSRHRPTCVPEGDEVLPGFKANKPPFSGERGRCRRQAVESRNIHFRTFGPIVVTEHWSLLFTGAFKVPPRVEQRPPSHARHRLLFSGK